jgi:hypothetical protein
MVRRSPATPPPAAPKKNVVTRSSKMRNIYQGLNENNDSVGVLFFPFIPRPYPSLPLLYPNRLNKLIGAIPSYTYPPQFNDKVYYWECDQAKEYLEDVCLSGGSAYINLNALNENDIEKFNIARDNGQLYYDSNYDLYYAYIRGWSTHKCGCAYA